MLIAYSNTMVRRPPVVAMAFALAALLLSGCATPALVPTSITDIDCRTHRLFAVENTRGTVLLFIEQDLPR